MEESSTLKLIMEKGPIEGETLEFKIGSVIRIGRVVRGNAVAIKDVGISSKHLSIEFKSGKWVLTDLNSSNGTFLNDAKLFPMSPYDLSSDDTIKIGEFTSIKVKIEPGDESFLRRNTRRRLKDGESDAGDVVAPSRNRRGAPKKNLASVSKNGELGLGIGGDLGASVEVVAESHRRRGQPRKAKNAKHEPQETLYESEKVDNVGPTEPKHGRQLNLRRTRSSKKEEKLNSETMLQKIPESSGLDGNDSKVTEIVASVEHKRDRRARGHPRRRRNLEHETLERVETEPLKEEIVEVLDLQSRGCNAVQGNSGVKKKLPPLPLEASNVDVPEEEGVEGSNDGCEGLASTSGVKEGGFEVGDGPDLEKMTLGEWFDYLEVYLPKQIHDATEEMISNMRRRAEQFREFMLQQKNVKEKDKVPMD